MARKLPIFGCEVRLNLGSISQPKEEIQAMAADARAEVMAMKAAEFVHEHSAEDMRVYLAVFFSALQTKALRSDQPARGNLLTLVQGLDGVRLGRIFPFAE